MDTQKETQAQKEARRFSELVADAARHPRLVTIMSARSDFLGRLQADAPLHAVKQQIDIAPLSPEGLSEVVRRPAAALDVAFEPGLDEALIANTPKVQVIMRRKTERPRSAELKQPRKRRRQTRLYE